jgi:hypothetical protein
MRDEHCDANVEDAAFYAKPTEETYRTRHYVASVISQTYVCGIRRKEFLRGPPPSLPVLGR